MTAPEKDDGMNELSYGQPSQQAVDDLGQALASQPAGSVATQELAQLILVGMQRDIESQIDWRLQQQKPGRRDVSQNEIGLILGSIGIGVPLTAIGGVFGGLPGILAVWIGLTLINLAWASRR
jgi:hypothetical protein